MRSNTPPTRASKWRASHGKIWVEGPCMRGFELNMVGRNAEAHLAKEVRQRQLCPQGACLYLCSWTCVKALRVPQGILTP